MKKAEVLFKNKKYEESALIYAETYSSFEEISLKFLQERETKALKSFLEAVRIFYPIFKNEFYILSKPLY